MLFCGSLVGISVSVPVRGYCIEDVSNDAYLSVASLWEMAIKISLGRLQLAQPFETFIPHQLSLNRIGLLGITMSHTAKVATLT